MPVEPLTLAAVAAGAALAGFTTGFAGFGTGLVASGLWYHVLPAGWVPPLVALTSVLAQLVGIVAVRRAFDWRRVTPYLVGGVAGVPLGVALLAVATPSVLRGAIGLFLVVYAAFEFAAPGRIPSPPRSSQVADGGVGLAGGFLGGFAGLSGPLPVIWLQLQGGSVAEQRAVYQPFNASVLSIATLAMAAAGQIATGVWMLALACLPVTLAAATAGARMASRAGQRYFRRIVQGLLLTSGLVLLVQLI